MLKLCVEKHVLDDKELDSGWELKERKKENLCNIVFIVNTMSVLFYIVQHCQ